MHFVISFSLCLNWELIFSFLHLSCFAWYGLHIWSILKRNTSFEILRTSAFMWTYSFSFYVNFYVCSEAFYIFWGAFIGLFLSFGQKSLNLQNSHNFSPKSTSRDSFKRRIESAFRICHLMNILWRNHRLKQSCQIAFLELY